MIYGINKAMVTL